MRRPSMLIAALFVGLQTLAATTGAQEPTVPPVAPFEEAQQADTSGLSGEAAQSEQAEKPKAKPKSSKPKRAKKEAEEGTTGATRLRSPATEDLEPTEAQKRREVQRRSALQFGIALVITALLLLLTQWIRRRLASPRVRRLLGSLVAILRTALFVFAILLGFQLVPTGSDWFWWATIATFVLVAWSVRDLFADLIAGIIITAERRIKKGTWVSGQGFEGTVERRSLRATWLRDGEGHQLTVPNRAMVGAPIVYDAGAEAEHEVTVRLEGYGDASRVRQALNDAVLSSPWVLAGAAPVVLRDPTDPVLWRVRSRLLEPRFAVHFSGELLERVEDILEYEGENPDAGETGSADHYEADDS